jgi:hypothetical protein
LSQGCTVEGGHPVPVAQGFIESVPVLAYVPGSLIAVGVVLFGLLAVYAVYWIIFRMGK